MSHITNGELLYVTSGRQELYPLATNLINQVRESAGEILNRMEVLESAKDILEERAKTEKGTQMTMPGKEFEEDMHEPFSTTWLNELRSQVGEK